MLKKFKIENSREYEYENLLKEVDTKQYTISGNPCNTLDACLKKCSYVDNIYNTVIKVLDIKKNNLNDSQKIKYLLKEIPFIFEHFIVEEAGFGEIDIIANPSLDKKISKFFFDIGFIYIFDNDKEVKLVLPKELQDIYNKIINSMSLKELYQDKITRCLFVYLISNGYMPIELMNDLIINFYHYPITPKEIKELVLKEGMNIYDKYYILFTKEGASDLIKMLEDKKKDYSYLRYSESEITNYFLYISNFIKDLKDILGGNIDNTELILNMIFLLYRDSFDVLDEKLSGLDKSKKNKIMDLVEENIDYINIWPLNGRCFMEWKFENDIKSNIIKLPLKNDLESCLKALSKERLEELKNDLEVNSLEEIKEMILDIFNDFLYDAELSELQPFFKSNIKAKALGDIDIGIYEYLFYYQEKDEIYLYLPLEYKESLDNIYYIRNLKEEKDYNQLVSDLIEMNGIIENLKLKNILKDYYIDLSLKELDNLVKKCGYKIINKKYYAINDFLDENILLILAKQKESFKTYKKIEYVSINKTEEFKDKVDSYVNKEFEGDIDIFEGVIINARLGGLDDVAFSRIREATDKEISKKQEKELIDIYNEYKNYLCCWLYNGFSVTEYKYGKRKS